MTTFKVFIGEEIRRFRIEATRLTYDCFLETLASSISNFHVELKTSYKDNEGDLIVFSSESEFQQMLQDAQVDHTVKVWIKESNVPYFKDGTVEVVRLECSNGEPNYQEKKRRVYPKLSIICSPKIVS